MWDGGIARLHLRTVIKKLAWRRWIHKKSKADEDDEEVGEGGDGKAAREDGGQVDEEALVIGGESSKSANSKANRDRSLRRPQTRSLLPEKPPTMSALYS